MNMNPQLAQNLEKFTTGIAEQGEDVVFRIFPSKIIELQELVLSTQSTDSPFNISHASSITDTTVYPPPIESQESEGHSKKRKLFTGDADGPPASASIRHSHMVKANKHLCGVHEQVKRETEEFASAVDTAKLWVTLTMPKIEDGDNFGVQIQEEVLSELQRAQESAYTLRDVSRQHHITRAKLCSKLIKYPNVEDYVLALKDHDEKQLYFARQHVIDLRNLYASLTDLIHKNITKIRVPKANNSVSLY